MVLGCFRLVGQYSDFSPVMKIDVLVETSVLIYDRPNSVASLKKKERRSQKKKEKKKEKKRKNKKKEIQKREEFVFLLLLLLENSQVTFKKGQRKKIEIDNPDISSIRRSEGMFS